MEWSDEAVVLGLRRHGEGALIMEAMTRGHGRHFGLVRATRGGRNAAALQPGNTLAVTWRARLDDHLGHYSIEPLALRAGMLMEQAAALYGLTHLCALLRLLPEREPHPPMYEALGVVLEHLDRPDIAGPLIVRFELAMLRELGFGLDLSACAATGATQELTFVSPKSGRAVSAAAGAAYADRLIPLPAFARDGYLGEHVSPADLAAGFRLTGFFLESRVWEPRGVTAPDQRAALLVALLGTRKDRRTEA
jgi:DNA repair protein RecO (recombination protein O)